MSSARVFFPRYSREELIDRLRDRLIELAAVLPLQEAVLFGSWARGRADAGSDIDLLVIYRGVPSADSYELTWRTLSTPGLELHLYSASEAAALTGTLSQMTDGGVKLYP